MSLFDTVKLIDKTSKKRKRRLKRESKYKTKKKKKSEIEAIGQLLKKRRMEDSELPSEEKESDVVDKYIKRLKSMFFDFWWLIFELVSKDFFGEKLAEEDITCPICLSKFVDPRVTPCGHTFCHKCISEYLLNAHVSKNGSEKQPKNNLFEFQLNQFC